MKISAVIITYNEEKNIEDAIRSVSWADEVVVVDSESTDRTCQLAEKLGARVLIRKWPGFSAQKQFAVDAANNEWILSLDADERVSDRLRDELLVLKASGVNADGYKVPRLSYYMGKAIKHGGWYPDLQLRFFDRRRGEWNGQVVHESLRMCAGAVVGILHGDLLHFSVESREHHEQMIVERYAPLGAQNMYEAGRRSSPIKALLASWFSFIRGYFLKAGFLDGAAGFYIAYFAARHTFMKHMQLIELQSKNRARSS